MLEGCTSTWAPVTSGVPQGSILGPLLFLVYINDIDTQLSSHVKLFADDCAIYNQVSYKADTSSLQSDLSSLYIWCVKWQLNLNLPKCKALCITNKRSPPNTTYYINNVPLEWVSEFTYLGVKITSNLSWRGHILAKTTKANHTLNLLRRTMYSCGKGAKKRAYEALVRPQVEYCSAVWELSLEKGCGCAGKVAKKSCTLDMLLLEQTNVQVV